MTFDIDLADIPHPIHRLSYTRISRFADGTRIVSTYDIKPNGYLSQRDRWTGQSEGRAQLVAQLLQARGYRLRGTFQPFCNGLSACALPPAKRGAQ